MSGTAIDPKKLPRVAALDTGVLILALGGRPDRPAAGACRSLLQALTTRDRSKGELVIVPAPVLAELYRGASGQPPRIAGVEIAAFSASTARLMAQHYTSQFIASAKQESVREYREHYIKYDLLIAATAIEREATLITLDTFLLNLGKPLEARSPLYYLAAQMELPLAHPTPAGKPTAPKRKR